MVTVSNYRSRSSNSIPVEAPGSSTAGAARDNKERFCSCYVGRSVVDSDSTRWPNAIVDSILRVCVRVCARVCVKQRDEAEESCRGEEGGGAEGESRRGGEEEKEKKEDRE